MVCLFYLCSLFASITSAIGSLRLLYFVIMQDWKIFVKPEEFWSFLQDMEEK